jgi:hypothetical protein
MSKRIVKTFEEFVGDLVNKHKQRMKSSKDLEIYSPNTNEPGKHYDQEDDGSDQINRSVILRYSSAEK